MGFGILLIGYFIAFSSMLTTSYFFGDAIGGVVILFALLKLSGYSSKYRPAVISAIVFTSLAIAGGISVFWGIADGLVPMIIKAAKTLSVLALHIYLFRAIARMASDADDIRLASKAKKGVAVISLYYLFASIYAVSSYYFRDETFDRYMTLIFYTYGIICVIMGSLIIHSAFARLFVVGEVRESPKESRIPLIRNVRNRFYESKVKADEENYRLMKEARDEALSSHSQKKYNKKKSRKKKK